MYFERLKDNFIKNLPTTYEITMITIFIYLSGVLYQVLKLVWWLTKEPNIWNLIFFSFSSSLNDFGVFFWYSFIIYFLSFTVIFLVSFLLRKVNVKRDKKVSYLFSTIILILFIVIYFFAIPWNKGVTSFTFYITPFILSSILAWLILYKRNVQKSIYYIFLILFIVYWFFMLLYGSSKYYACNQIRCNDAIKNCVLLEYKNDKYGFTGDGDIYNLDEFKAFYTYNYFKDGIKTWTESCE